MSVDLSQFKTRREIVSQSWETIVEIDRKNDGYVEHNLIGTMKEGTLTQKSMTFYTDFPTHYEEMNVKIINNKSNLEIEPWLEADGDRFKRIIIPFSPPLEKDDEFNIKISYKLPRAFRAIGSDYYFHKVDVSDRVSIKIIFPRGIKVKNVNNSKLLDSFDQEIELPQDDYPKINRHNEQDLVEWNVENTPMGFKLKIQWETALTG